MRGIVLNVSDMELLLMISPCISLHCKLVPVQYQGCKSGLLIIFFSRGGEGETRRRQGTVVIVGA